jgi:carboxypeptidase C (cathepsin A)
MDFNGIVLISTVLDLGTLSFNPGDDLSYILYLPSYAATAWYHKVLKDPPADLNAFLMEARHFAATSYADALMKGASLGEAERAEVAKQVAHFTGLGEDYVRKADLRVNLSAVHGGAAAQPRPHDRPPRCALLRLQLRSLGRIWHSTTRRI